MTVGNLYTKPFIAKTKLKGGLIQKVVLLFAALAVFSNIGYAQLASKFSFVRSSSAYSSISGSGTLVSSSGSAVSGGVQSDDGNQASIPIGFTFVYCGASYTQVSVGANGVVSLANNVVGFVPAAANINGAGFLMALWTDLWGAAVAGGSPIAYYQTTGAVGSRVFTVEYNDWAEFGSGSGLADHSNFQVKLYEGSNKVEFRYGSIVTTPPNIAIGISNSTSDYQTLPTGSSTTANTSFTTGLTFPATNSVLTWSPLYFNNGNSQSLSVCQNSSPTSLNTMLTSTDFSGPTLTWSVVTAPTNGVLTGFPASTAAGVSVAPTGTAFQP
ncbi:MAG: hypothetical protein K1X77_11700, partial [Bacteroidia bacterium]|nr:hypothetical protein [Bacteroidia bacterium]